MQIRNVFDNFLLVVSNLTKDDSAACELCFISGNLRVLMEFFVYFSQKNIWRASVEKKNCVRRPKNNANQRAKQKQKSDADVTRAALVKRKQNDISAIDISNMNSKNFHVFDI